MPRKIQHAGGYALIGNGKTIVWSDAADMYHGEAPELWINGEATDDQARDAIANLQAAVEFVPAPASSEPLLLT